MLRRLNRALVLYTGQKRHRFHLQLRVRRKVTSRLFAQKYFDPENAVLSSF